MKSPFKPVLVPRSDAVHSVRLVKPGVTLCGWDEIHSPSGFKDAPAGTVYTCNSCNILMSVEPHPAQDG